MAKELREANKLAKKLERAVKKNQREEKQQLLEAGTNPHAIINNNHILATALFSSIDIIKVLLAAVADPNAKESRGKSVLYWATDILLRDDKSREKLRLLLKAGADLKALDQGSPILYWTLPIEETDLYHKLFLLTGAHTKGLIVERTYANSRAAATVWSRS